MKDCKPEIAAPQAKPFCNDETGAVTVDWVVLTAAVIGLGMVVLTPVAFETDSVATLLGSSIGARESGYVSAND